MNHRPRKRFGQNFLRDEGVIHAIARAVAAHETDHIVEIGPGEGALTEALITSGCQLDAIELDRDLRARLLAAFSGYPRFTLHSADALNFDFASLAEGQNIRVVGNLPYNISTPLIFKLLDYGSVISDMHFMLQHEVVERMGAKPGNKEWGRLGVMTQFRCEVEPLFAVPPEAFYPPPKVQSAIVRLAPHLQCPWPECDPVKLNRIVTQAFAQRRKTLRNNFKNTFDDSTMQSLGIDPSARAESLSLNDFVALASLPKWVTERD